MTPTCLCCHRRCPRPGRHRSPTEGGTESQSREGRSNLLRLVTKVILSPAWGWTRPGSCHRRLPRRPRPGPFAQGWGRAGSCPDCPSRLGTKTQPPKNTSPDDHWFFFSFFSFLKKRGNIFQQPGRGRRGKRELFREETDISVRSRLWSPRRSEAAGIAALKSILIVWR